MLKTLIPFTILVFVLSSCTDTNPKNSDSPTSGKLNIVVEKGYEPVLRSAIAVFDSTYADAEIFAEYVPEAQVVLALVNQEAQLGVISRKLKEAELVPFKNRGFEPEQTCIAHDALAFIVHPSNMDTTLSMQTIEGIFNGSIKKWSDINPANKAGNIQIVFDNQNSGTVRYAIDSINKGNDMPSNAFATNSNQEVIRYIEKSKNSIGIISNNWISDTDDKGIQNFLRSIALMGISRTAKTEAFKPYQAHLYTNDYPYKRSVYAINSQPRAFGLGRGFASFLAGPTGQLIIYKDGLLPNQMQPRLIQVEQK